MCGRYVIKSKIETIEKRFNVSIPEEVKLKPNYNVSPGDHAPVITNDKPNEIQMFRFGMQPFWSKKSMFLFNARAEGDKNQDNDPNYTGANEIVNKPAFRKPIRSQRCLVIGDAFIEGPTKEKLNKPYLVYIKNNTSGPLAFAGIWDTWVDNDKGEVLNSYSIITTQTNNLLQKIPHHRSPVIFQNREDEQLWLNTEAPLAEAVNLLRPFPGDKMNAYPISTEIKNSIIKDIGLLKPVGERLVAEYEYRFKKYIESEGMGMTRARKSKE